MEITLDRTARRIIGVLIEKELTTPNLYPLTLNALTAGCNQKSNRDPHLSLQEFEIEGALKSLYVREWVTNVSGAGSRTLKWRHRAHERMGVEPRQLAVMAELLLRGAQQPGELRSRAGRMHRFGSLDELQSVLEELTGMGLVEKLPRRSGERAARYDHRLYPEGEGPAAAPATEPPPVAAAVVAGPAPVAAEGAAAPLEARVAALEEEVRRLRALVEPGDADT